MQMGPTWPQGDPQHLQGTHMCIWGFAFICSICGHPQRVCGGVWAAGFAWSQPVCSAGRWLVGVCREFRGFSW